MLTDHDARAACVAELNIQQSIDVLKQHPAIERAISERGMILHSLIYDICAGQLRLPGEADSWKAHGLWSSGK